MTAQDPRPDRYIGDAHATPVGPGSDSPQANDAATPDIPSPAGPQTPPPAILRSTPTAQVPVVEPLLFVHATAHEDLEKVRIASENRLRSLTHVWVDDDGVEHGFGLDPSQPDVARLQGITDALRRLEHDAELGLARSLRRSAIGPWVKAQKGLGDKQAARLLAAIDDPYWHALEDRPRTVSELWAYSGLHVLPASHKESDPHPLPAGGGPTGDPDHTPPDAQSISVGVAAKRRKGQKANWSTEAKTRAYLCAASCVKQLRQPCHVDDDTGRGSHVLDCECSPYRVVYDARRSHTDKTHEEDWTDGHSHNDGLRIAAKEILKDLWREARRLHLAAP